MNIEALRIRGLHGRSSDVYLPINDNRAILVGVNGIGKTTILNIIYYLFTQQWINLAQIVFDSVEFLINGKVYGLSRSEIDAFAYEISRLRTRIPASIVRRIEGFRGTPAFYALLSGERLNSAMEVELSTRLSVSAPTLRRIQADLRGERTHSPDLFSEENRAVGFSEFLRKNLKSTILYLPTYRRIEKELKHLRRAVDIEEGSEPRARKKSGPRSQVNFLEMAEFGMGDVELLISDKCEAVNRVESVEFKELIADYLGKIINNQVSNFDVTLIQGLNESQINRVLNRVQDENLKPLERKRIQDTISRIARDPLSARAEDIYVGQLFFGLMNMAERLYVEEKAIHDFINTINQNYLVDKKLHYVRERRTIKVLSERRGHEIKFSDLSSGEKQVVSVFCHLYLGESQSYFVLIDEPELSLSIDWQEHFLNDILSSQVCSFLFAVTHSPFTFSGDLKKYRTELAVN